MERRTYGRYIIMTIYENPPFNTLVSGLLRLTPIIIQWYVGYFRDQDKKGVFVGKKSALTVALC